jgi:hypothetical protein
LLVCYCCFIFADCGVEADMELMEENLTLQANLAEKDEIIDGLKKELKAFKQK